MTVEVAGGIDPGSGGAAQGGGGPTRGRAFHCASRPGSAPGWELDLAFAIVSVDDSRAATRRDTRQRMSFIPEATGIDFVDGRDVARLRACLRTCKRVNPELYVGELGVWFSQLNCWAHLAASDLGALLVLEDDAAVDPEIEPALRTLLAHVPAGWDFVALHVPADQKADYFYRRQFEPDGSWRLVDAGWHTLESSPHHVGDPIVAAAYQGYSTVAMLYSRAGAERLLRLAAAGIFEPVDCFIFRAHHRGHLRGYAPKPYIRDLVEHRDQGSLARGTGTLRETRSH
jgi:GR25 family glycosyltransferase involved in LPS biosynthesis